MSSNILENVFPEDHPLSNCFPLDYGMTYGDVWYSSAEHAYQAQKFDPYRDAEIIKLIINAPTGPDASRIARSYSARMDPDWEVKKVAVIYAVMMQKFLQHPDLKQFLMDTDPETLYEEANAKEFMSPFWGTDTDEGGDNVIGNILMQLRQEFINGER
jgi:ribA/ribD-fused uncharacterized protein